jgi:hypothetical protein
MACCRAYLGFLHLHGLEPQPVQRPSCDAAVFSQKQVTWSLQRVSSVESLSATRPSPVSVHRISGVSASERPRFVSELEEAGFPVHQSSLSSQFPLSEVQKVLHRTNVAVVFIGGLRSIIHADWVPFGHQNPPNCVPPLWQIIAIEPFLEPWQAQPKAVSVSLILSEGHSPKVGFAAGSDPSFSKPRFSDLVLLALCPPRLLGSVDRKSFCAWLIVWATWWHRWCSSDCPLARPMWEFTSCFSNSIGPM